MAHICSCVKAIDDVHLQELPVGRKIKGEIIRAGRIILVRTEKGGIYQHGMAKVAYGIGDWPWLTGVLKALVKLKRIQQSEMESHAEYAKKVSAESSAKYARDQLDNLLKEHKLTSQKKIRDFLAGPRPRKNDF